MILLVSLKVIVTPSVLLAKKIVFGFISWKKIKGICTVAADWAGAEDYYFLSTAVDYFSALLEYWIRVSTW